MTTYPGPRRLFTGIARAVMCITLITAVVSPTAAKASPPVGYSMTVWSAGQGLQSGDVFAITQDLEGYLWLGTPTGLLRFDGSRFVRWAPIDPTESLPAGPVHALIGSRDGSVWVGLGGGGGVVRIDKGRIVRHTAEQGAPPGVTAMLQDREGAIWVANRRGLFRFLDNRWTAMSPADGYAGSEAFSLYEDRAGRLWAGTAAGVYQRDRKMFRLVDPTATAVQSLVEDATGAIWVTDASEILKRLGSPSTPRHAPNVRLPAGGWRLLRDGHDQLWAASFGGGLLRIVHPSDREAIIDRVEFEDKLPGSPRSLYEDREGNIWVGMRGGLLRLSANSFGSAGPLEGLTNDGVHSAAVGQDGSVWIATGHGLNRFSGSSRAAYDVPQTMALHTDRRGVLWIAGSREIGRFEHGRFVPLAIPDTIRSSRVMAITTDSRDTLWVCSALRGVMSWDGKAVARFEEHPEVSNRGCQSIYTDREDRVWVGLTSGGAAVFQDGVFQTFGARDGFTRGTVLAILEDRSGAIWFNTTGGVSRYQNGRFTAITEANAPMVDLVPVLVDDEEGYIWVGVNSGAGVIRFHPGEVDKIAGNAAHQIEYALYDESDGMQQGSQTWQSGVGGVRGGDGRLWVASGLGMTIIDPRSLPPIRRPPPPRIDAVLADGQRVSPTRDLELPAATSTLRFDYGTASLSSASKLRFRYMLEGVDEDWVYAGRVREATYANLRSGAHRFRVSTTHNGQWTEAASWDFSIAPPFYLTRLFLMLATFGIALALAAAWWVRIRAVKRQYALVLAERARVGHEIHDTLLQSLAAIGVELESIATELDPVQAPARDGLRRLRRQVGHCLREARESILELRQRTMKPRALVDLLGELADTTTRTKGVGAEFVSNGRGRSCSADADTQLFRIAQEAVSNAIRHGRATQVRIGLAAERAHLVLTVADNGCGFAVEALDPAPETGEHLGLLTMRERAARVRGQLAIVSTPGTGTTVQARVPVAAE